MSTSESTAQRAPIAALFIAVIVSLLLVGVPRVAVASSRDDLVVEVGSYDLAVGPATRFIAGVFTADHRYVGWGTVQMQFSFLGSGRASTKRVARPASVARFTAHFLAVPGVAIKPEPTAPTILSATKGRGVYASQVSFDRPGFWQVAVKAHINGGPARTATAAFEVLDHHLVPAPGDAALATENLTLSSPGTTPQSIDSRASAGSIPDPDLHRSTIADALRAHQPAVVVFSTPAFCTSRMCGPITDMIQRLAKDDPDRASFVHVEIWKSFADQQVNDAASEWLAAHGNDLREPWVFLIGADGRIAARWDNVVTRGEIEPLLRMLPSLAAAPTDR